MQKLQDIEVRTEAPRYASSSQGNALPVLHEILYALQRLNKSGESTTIDLRAIPFGPGDEKQLMTMLGRGEVEIRLDSLGTSEIWESNFQGVWIIKHKNALGEPIALQIEVTRMPEIVRSQQADINESISRLDAQLRAEIQAADVSPSRRRDG